MYKNAARFSQRATRSPLSWEHSLAIEARRGRSGLSSRKKGHEERIASYLRTEAGEKFMASLMPLIAARGRAVSRHELLHILNENEIRDPKGYPWSRSTAGLLFLAMVRRRQKSILPDR